MSFLGDIQALSPGFLRSLRKPGAPQQFRAAAVNHRGSLLSALLRLLL